MTYPDSYLPSPLPVQTFYVLLALARTPLHAYAIRSAVLNASLGSVNLSISRLYTLVNHLHDEALIETTGPKPAGKSGKARTHYTISKYGTIRLKEEALRLNHAVGIAKSAGLMQTDDIPTDIQRILLAQNLQQ